MKLKLNFPSTFFSDWLDVAPHNQRTPFPPKKKKKSNYNLTHIQTPQPTSSQPTTGRKSIQPRILPLKNLPPQHQHPSLSHWLHSPPPRKCLRISACSTPAWVEWKTCSTRKWKSISKHSWTIPSASGREPGGPGDCPKKTSAMAG